MIYIASTAASPAKPALNLALAQYLEKNGQSVFLPQRDGININKAPYVDMSRDDKRRAVFEKSRDLLIACDSFVIVLDGQRPDEGLCLELGLAYAHRLITGCKRLIIGLQTDGSFFLGAKLNPSVQMCLDSIVDKQEALIKAIVLHTNKT